MNKDMNKFILDGIETLEIEIEALELGKTRINESFCDAIKLIQECAPNGRVVVMGMGKSGHIGKKIAATLASTGTPSFFVHPAEAGHGDLGMITKKDIVIGISQSGRSEELLATIPYIKRHGIKLIAMTGNLKSPLSENADIIIDTSVKREACPLGLAPTASTTLTLSIGDALAVCLLKDKGFTDKDFADTHPHGALGKKLILRVSDIMSNIDDSPKVYKGASLKHTLLQMTKGGLGFITIVDTDLNTFGVFTDGDLRRTLEKNIDINKIIIDDVMTSKFTSILDTELAVKAVDLMEKNKIIGMPVISKENKLVGALNIRQLLQRGVV